MHYRRQFFVGSKYLGEVPCGPIQAHEDSIAPYGEAYFCPVCGDVWARVVVSSPLSGQLSPFMVRAIPCEKHDKRTFCSIPGSLYLGWGREYNTDIPDELVQYEFQQAMKLYG